MSKDYRPQFNVEIDPFWDEYYACMHHLRGLGMIFPRRTRLDCFRLYHRLCGMELTKDVQEALDSIERLTELKRRGQEPASKNGKYTI